MTYIKICGIKEARHALAAAKAGADFIGLVFAPSSRRINLEKAQHIASAVKQSGCPTEVVGIFVNLSVSTVNMVADNCNLDRVQLSGDETWEYCKEIAKPLIKAVRLKRGQSAAEVCAYLAEGAKAMSNQKHLFLLDPQVRGKYGGTGTRLDWNLAGQIAMEYPVILAGGLTPENVSRALKMVAPWGVDVSSGVEAGGVKHVARIKAFIEAVRRFDEHGR
ncbi:MAG: phosphoribosylanthranilate isomerase [Dehalococcoidales bacterium]